jgi:hypothetical protein
MWFVGDMVLAIRVFLLQKDQNLIWNMEIITRQEYPHPKWAK